MEPATDKSRRAPYHHGDLRAHLIETVRQLVEEKGADGFSVSEAARRAGVSSAAPYKHFCDRNEIVRAVALGGIERMRQEMDAAAKAATGDETAPITALGMCYAAFARREPGVFRLMFGLTKGHDKDPELQERGAACFDVLKREVRAVLPADAPESEVERRAYMLHMFVHGHAFLEIDAKHDTNMTPDQEWAMISDVSRRVMV